MKTNNLLSAKNAILTILILSGISTSSIASSFKASFNGNWSSTSTWGGSIPGFDVTKGNNITIPAGVTVTLDSDLTVSGILYLTGTLDLNGRNLTISGNILTSDLGTIIGNTNSDITFNGYGGAGNIVLTPGSQTINNFTINIGSNGGMYLGSGLTVGGLLTLKNGYLGIGDNNLVVSGKSIILGGSATSYIMTNGTGSLVMQILNSGSAVLLPIGTQNNYAPLSVTNNSTSTGTFSVAAYEGVFAAGNTGSDICTTQGMVNTSWNISSTIATDVNVDLEMFWNTGMQGTGFDNTQAYVSQYQNTGWNDGQLGTATLNNNGLLSLKLAGVTSLSQYAVFGKSAATGISNVTAKTEMSLYPNPANSSINLSLASSANYPLLKVFDVTGKEVITQQIENSLTALNISSLQSGTYFASLNGQAAQKFIKE